MSRYYDIVAGLLGDELDDSEVLGVFDDEDYDVIEGLEDDLDWDDVIEGEDDIDDLIDELTSGYGLDIISGRRKRRSRSRKRKRSTARKAMLKKALAKRLIDQGTIIKKSAPTKSRVWELGFDSVTPVLAGQTRSIVQRPQVTFKGQRLLIPSDIAGQFLIQDIIIGQKSQLAAASPLPGRRFQENVQSPEFDLDTAQISQDVVLRAENIGTTDQRFFADLKGKIVD